MSTPTATIFVPWHALGTWTDVPFTAADFTSNAGSWTVDAGDVTAHAYTVIGQTAVVTLQLALSTAIVGAPAALFVALPAGLTAARPGIGMAALYMNGWQLGHVIAVTNLLVIQRPDQSAFLDVASFGGYFTVTFAVV